MTMRNLWNSDLLNQIQDAEDRIFNSINAITVKGAITEMEMATEKWIRKTKPTVHPAKDSFIGEFDFAENGEVLSFRLTPMNKYEKSKFCGL